MRFSTYLSEGLIKLPSKMFEEGSSYIVSQICSYAIAEIKAIKDPSPYAKKVEDHIDQTAKQHKASVKPMRKMSHSKTVLKKVYDDLPEKYKVAAEKFEKGLTLWLGWTNDKAFSTKNGYFRNTDEGIIGVSIAPLVMYDWKKNVTNLGTHKEAVAEEHFKALCDRFDHYIERILETFEHELTHFVQRKILPHSEKQFSGVTASEKGKRSAYLTSTAEFDPILRDEVKKYLRQEKENVDIKMDRKKGRSDWIAAFVCSKTFKADEKRKMLDLPDKVIGYVKPSDFFEALKKHNEKRWKLACKLFTQEVEKRAP